MTRRDKCHLVGKRAARLTLEERARAWESLAIRLEALGYLDVPKFQHLLGAIRNATIQGKQVFKS